MDMKSWRLAEGLSMAKAASLLTLDSARAYQRYETGENRPDAHVVERIIQVSGGAITLNDLHHQRLSWLRANRPDLTIDVMEAAE